MKTRQLVIRHIDEAQLLTLLKRVQKLRYLSTGYFLLNEPADWYIILYVLREKGIIEVGNRMPFTAFLRWMEEHAFPWGIARPTAKELSHIACRLGNDSAPWTSPYAPQNARQKWYDLYYHFSRMINPN